MSFQPTVFTIRYNSNYGQHSQQCLIRTKSERFSIPSYSNRKMGRIHIFRKRLGLYIYIHLLINIQIVSGHDLHPLGILFKHSIPASGIYLWENIFGIRWEKWFNSVFDSLRQDLNLKRGGEIKMRWEFLSMGSCSSCSITDFPLD